MPAAKRRRLRKKSVPQQTKTSSRGVRTKTKRGDEKGQYDERGNRAQTLRLPGSRMPLRIHGGCRLGRRRRARNRAAEQSVPATLVAGAITLVSRWEQPRERRTAPLHLRPPFVLSVFSAPTVSLSASISFSGTRLTRCYGTIRYPAEILSLRTRGLYLL